jgi:hypothetical protein
MKSKTLYALSFVLFLALACSSTSFPAPDPTAATLPQSAPPTEAVFTPIPTFTLAPEPASLSASLTLGDSPLNESGAGPVYTITAQVPSLQGSDSPRVTAFNARLKEIVQKNVDQFRNDILANQPITPFNAGSSFDVSYELIGQRGEVWSIKFAVMSYMDGAAHPNHYTVTLNYDLAQGRELALDELFLHGVNHMGTISDYCKAELSKRDIGFADPIFQTGADPTPENYRNWNLSNDGLLVTFDQYQVAPYAAGQQTVVIPFAILMPLASPQSALHVFNQ